MQRLPKYEVNERDGFYLTDIYSVWTASKNGRKFVMQTANGIGTVPFEWERWRANPSGALVSVKEIYEPSITDLIPEGQARALDEAGYDVVKRKSDHG